MQAVTILLVEDDPGHARLIAKNLQRAKISNEIITFTDGQQALAYLFGLDANGNHTPAPLLVLLDLNLPVVSGYQVLEQMKSHERTRHIPVIILTTTDDPQEIRRCYELGCNVYVVKPVEYTQFAEAIQKLGLFFSVVTVPATR
jgi:CheY-like chemotaxis protein